MDVQIATELRRISNRLQMLATLCEIFLVKEFSQDSEVMETIKTLQAQLEEAEGEAYASSNQTGGYLYRP